MTTPFILVEDADVNSTLVDAVQQVNAAWELQLHKITDAAAYDRAIETLANPPCGNLVAAFDLDYYDKVGEAAEIRYWDQMKDHSKESIPLRTKHGVNALLCLLSNLKQGNCLVVVASQFSGDDTDPGRALRSEIQRIAKEKRSAAAIHAYFPGGPLTVRNALLTDRLRAIQNAWNSFFGSMASQLRSSQNAGWFKEGAEYPAYMRHDLVVTDSMKEDVTRWLACVSGADAIVVRTSLDRLFAKDGSGFYKHALQRVTGACALHCGREFGKALNMHGLAFIACCYTSDFASVFDAIEWLTNKSERLIDEPEDSTVSENLLYALVGKPTDQPAAPPSGVFGILGVDDGREGGTKGRKTVTSVKLASRNVQITFAIRGRELAEKHKTKGATGSAFCALQQLSNIVTPYGVSVACTGTESELTLTIAKP